MSGYPDNIHGFWIGGNDLAGCGNWVWSRGQAMNSSGAYQNWASDQNYHDCENKGSNMYIILFDIVDVESSQF